MYIFPLKQLLISLLVIVSTTFIAAQPKDNSPFSQFGLGDFFETDMPSSHGMGGMSAVYHDFFEANLENPASLGFLQYTCLQLGMFAKRSTYSRINDKQNVWSGNLDHLSLNFPIINPLNEALERRETEFAWGTSVSLRPYSQVGYFVRISDAIDSIGDVERTFTGSGGLYQITWGNGIKYKNFSAGLNLTYIYGKQNFNEDILFLDLENAYRDIFESTISYKGFNYRIGAIYEQPLDLKAARAKEDKPSKLLSIGAFISGRSTLETRKDETKIAFNNIINDSDTAVFVIDQEGEAILPGTFGVGLMYRQTADFRIGIDYQLTPWSIYKNDARESINNPTKMSDTYRLGFGAAWIPDASSITSYFKRVEYRAGFYKLSDPRHIKEEENEPGEQVKASAVTLGAGFPLILQRNIAWLQVGLDVGRRTGGDRLSENFVRGKVGFIFNDNSWFIKGKYD